DLGGYPRRHYRYFPDLAGDLAVVLSDWCGGGDLSGRICAEKQTDRVCRNQHQQPGRGAVDYFRPAGLVDFYRSIRGYPFHTAGGWSGADLNDVADHYYFRPRGD